MTLPEPVCLVVLTNHDLLFFASQDYDSHARPADLIGNYALMYAINRNVSDVRRVVSGTKPHYQEDLPKMEVYATPAAPSESFTYTSSPAAKSRNWDWLENETRIGDQQVGDWDEDALIPITWNSIGESLLDVMKRDGLNIPKTGTYYRYPPLASFYFYTVGGRVPKVFRLGKKYASVRASTYEVQMERKDGIFESTCPVNVADLPERTEIIEGGLMTVPPAPLLVNAKLKGPYLQGSDMNGFVHRIPQPDPEKYATSWGALSE